MSDVTPREALEREKARLLEEAEMKAREAADATTRAAQIERDLAELDRIAAKYNLTVRVPAKQFAHGTVGALVDSYRHDGRSPYKKLRFKTRAFYDSNFKVILEICGDRRLSELKTHDIQKLYDDYTEGRTRRMMMAHSVMTMLRGLINFGVTALNDKECERLSVLLHHMHFPVERSKVKYLTPEQASAIIDKAHEIGMHSIALAQAIQFDCKFTQIDTIGEWVPLGEPGMSDVTHGDLKWLRGIRWEEVDANWVLHHELSHSGNLVERSLRQAPLTMKELARLGELPRRGPIVISEKTGRPFTAVDFRRHWRKIARECGIPDDVRSMGSRAGQSRAFDHEGEKRTRPEDAGLQPSGRGR